MKLAKILVCCAVAMVAVYACQGDAGNQDRSVAGDVLDPETYRAEIQALENDMYAAEFDANVRSALAIKLEDLATKVAQEDGAFQMIYAVEMRQLAGAVQADQKATVVREQWERIRVSLFNDAVWYRWRNAPKRPQVASQVELPGDNQLHQDYAYVLRKLDDLVVRGRRDVERMGEPRERTTDYLKGDYQYLVEEWDNWAGNWRQKLAYLEGDLPDQPGYQEDAALRFAHDNLLKAIQWLEAVPVGRGQWKTPFRTHWEKCFSHAEDELEKARSQIEK